MIVIDNIGMAVPQGQMAMVNAGLLRGAVVHVLFERTRIDLRMFMLNFCGIMRRPDIQCSGKACTRDGRHGQRRQLQAMHGAKPARERISQQPAGVGKRKLCCEQRRSVLGMG